MHVLHYLPTPRTLTPEELEATLAAGLTWRELLPFGLVPALAGADGDDGGSGDGGDGDGGDGGSGDGANGSGDGDGDGDGDEGDDGDEGGTELERARRALAAARREAKSIKDGQTKRERDALREAGKHKELAATLQTEIDALRAEIATERTTNMLVAELKRVGFRNPERAVRLVDDLDKIEDKADAERAAKRLAKDEPDLLEKKPARQVRNGGNRNAADDAGGDDDKKPKPVGVDRIRAGLTAG